MRSQAEPGNEIDPVFEFLPKHPRNRVSAIILASSRPILLRNPVSEPCAIVSFEQTRRIGSSGDNAARIQREQIAVIIALHSLQIASASNSGQLVQIAQISTQMLVILNAAHIAFEQAVVNGIKTE